MDMYEIVKNNPVLAILRNVPLGQAVDYAGAAVAGGVRFFEVALNSEGALAEIALLRERLGETAMIGAGTAVTVKLAKEALAAGAQFLLAPSAPEEVLRYCAEHGNAFLPGVFSPTEVGLCERYGFHTLKLFPAGDLPRSYVSSLKGPFPGADYVAIGGVTRENARAFLDAGCIGVGLGSNLMPRDAAARGDWDCCAAAVRQLAAGLG